jgi:uncharacterized membrane protein YphA (DoxX/SURF4 family)
MKIVEPLGSASVGPLIIRMALGLYFLLVGMEKIDKIPNFVFEIQQFHILPAQAAWLYGTLLPVVEIVVGIMMMIGVWMTLTGTLAALILASVIAFFGIFPNRYFFFNKDLILLAASISLLYTGAGAASIDNMKR